MPSLLLLTSFVALLTMPGNNQYANIDKQRMLSAEYSRKG